MLFIEVCAGLLDLLIHVYIGNWYHGVLDTKVYM
jgi:hypothetical protein